MRIFYTIALVAFASMLAGCSNNSFTNSTKSQAILDMKRATDYHSFSKPNEAIVNHLEWDAKVDFDTRTIEATATYSITTSKDVKRIILDIRELNISSVKVDSKEATYEIGEEMLFIGSPLAINITPESKEVSITYTTQPGADALLWVEGENPFLFTQRHFAQTIG